MEERVRVPRVLLAGVVAGLGYVVVEFVVEGLVAILFNVSEDELLARYFDFSRSGFRYALVDNLIFFAECVVIMWIYALMRSHGRPVGQSLLVTVAMVLLLALLPLASLANVAVFPGSVVLLSLGFSVIELPTAILCGAGAYEWRRETAATP